MKQTAKSYGMLSKMVLVGTFSLATVVSAPLAQADIKIGYIDLQKAIQETSAGKKAKKELEKDFNAKNEEFQKKGADIKKTYEDLDKKKSVMNKETFEARMRDLSEDQAKLQQQMAQSQTALQKRERELTKPILDKLQEIIDKEAKDGGYTVILERSEQSVLWAKKEIDLTDIVVKAFEKGK